MIDNPNQTDRLVEKLDAALPIAAVVTPECLALFRKETGVDRLTPQCLVSQIHYAGDEGGIVCGLDTGRAIGERVLYVSITHLRSIRGRRWRAIFSPIRNTAPNGCAARAERSRSRKRHLTMDCRVIFGSGPGTGARQ